MLLNEVFLQNLVWFQQGRGEAGGVRGLPPRFLQQRRDFIYFELLLLSTFSRRKCTPSLRGKENYIQRKNSLVKVLLPTTACKTLLSLVECYLININRNVILLPLTETPSQLKKPSKRAREYVEAVHTMRVSVYVCLFTETCVCVCLCYSKLVPCYLHLSCVRMFHQLTTWEIKLCLFVKVLINCI